MKRILSLILCLLMTSVFITGCSDSTIDDFRNDLGEYDDLELPRDREAMVLDFYIICEEGTTENSASTVESYINSHLSDIYNTTLDIHYLTADEYQQKVLTDAAKTDDDRADIVLVAGKSMFDELYSKNLLADITSYYSTTKFGLLKTQIAASLLKSAVVKVPAVDMSGNSYLSSRYFTVPNNHVIGEYQYLLIDKAKAREHNYADRKLEEMLTYESTAELRDAIGADADQYVKLVSGNYTDKAKYEAQGFLCNVVSYPIADVEEAFMSAFSIVRHPLDTRYKDKESDISIESQNVYKNHYERCMEIIYALNTDVDFRNLLQYGHKGTNYSFDEQTDTVTSYTEGAGVYKMKLIYTGDVFKAYFCEQIGWTKEVFLNGENQNKEAVVPTKE